MSEKRAEEDDKPDPELLKALKASLRMGAPEPSDDRIARLERRIVERDAELTEWARRYDDAVQPLQKRAQSYIERAEKAERERDEARAEMDYIRCERDQARSVARKAERAAEGLVAKLRAAGHEARHADTCGVCAALSAWDASKEKP